MFFTSKNLISLRLIRVKWITPFLFLLFSFSLFADFRSECQIKIQFVPIEISGTYEANIAKCIKEKQAAAAEAEAMDVAIQCLEGMINDYDINVKSSKDEKEDEDEKSSSEALIVAKLKESCQQKKQSAEQCCSNPNSCNGFGMDLVQHVLPMAPGLYGAYKSYKISGEASKGKISYQDFQKKMCDANNKASLGVFATNLLSQLMPMFQKTCGKSIKKCKQACNREIDAFKLEFKNCYARLFPDKEISDSIRLAKKCFDITDLKDEDFDDDKNYEVLKDNENHIYKNIVESASAATSTPVYKCDYLSDKGIQEATPPQQQPSLQVVALSRLLYIAKAYKLTTKDNSLLSESSNEKEIVDCHKQPNRVLTSSYQPGGPVPPPLVQMCEQAVDYAVNKRPPPMAKGKSNDTSGIASFAGNTDNGPGPGSSLQIPSGEECQYGVLDAESLEKCLTGAGDGEDDFSTNKKPSLADNPPGWKSGEGSSGSSGDNGGIGGAGLGSLAGDTGSSRDGSMYPPYSGDMSSSAGFIDSDFDSMAYGQGDSNGPAYRSPSEKSEDDADFTSDDMPFGEENLDGGKSIFQLASERIQSFCSDYSCDK